jgi:hypothetical protein
LRLGERRFGVHDPPLLAERHQVAEKGTLVTQADVVAEELEATRGMQLLQVGQEQLCVGVEKGPPLEGDRRPIGTPLKQELSRHASCRLRCRRSQAV